MNRPPLWATISGKKRVGKSSYVLRKDPENLDQELRGKGKWVEGVKKDCLLVDRERTKKFGLTGRCMP